MVEIRHWLLPGCPRLTGRVPVQVEDHVKAGLVQARRVGTDCRPVSRAAVPGREAVDTKPAVFVQGNAHRVDAPRCHDGYRLHIRWSIGEPTINARVLCARAVYPEQAEGSPFLIDELVPDHPHGQRWLRLSCPPCDYRDHGQAKRQGEAQTDNRSAASRMSEEA